MGKSVVVVFSGGGGITSWTPDVDVILTGAYVESGGSVDVSLSTDPSVDVNNLFDPGVTVYTQLIALFQIVAQPGFRTLYAPVLAGESVYFSADSACSVQLNYLAAETTTT